MLYLPADEVFVAVFVKVCQPSAGQDLAAIAAVKFGDGFPFSEGIFLFVKQEKRLVLEPVLAHVHEVGFDIFGKGKTVAANDFQIAGVVEVFHAIHQAGFQLGEKQGVGNGIARREVVFFGYFETEDIRDGHLLKVVGKGFGSFVRWDLFLSGGMTGQYKERSQGNGTQEEDVVFFHGDLLLLKKWSEKYLITPQIWDGKFRNNAIRHVYLAKNYTLTIISHDRLIKDK